MLTPESGCITPLQASGRDGLVCAKRIMRSGVTIRGPNRFPSLVKEQRDIYILRRSLDMVPA